MSQTIPRQRLHAPPAISEREQRVQAFRKDLMGEFATTEEMRDVLGYEDIRSVYDLCEQGMPFLKLGNKRLYDKEAVKDWLRTRKCNLPGRPVGRPVGRPRGSPNKKKRVL